MKPKVDEKKRRSFLRLVVDAGNRIDLISNEKSSELNENIQFEMFGSPDSILFAEVRSLTFKDIQNLIDKYQVNHIIDLREVPYLNFNRSNRDRFFRYLHSNSIDYLSLFSFASKNKNPSIGELMKDDLSLGVLTTEITNWIGKGPTLALINRDREHDPIAKSFTQLLKKTNISFSEIMN